MKMPEPLSFLPLIFLLPSGATLSGTGKMLGWPLKQNARAGRVGRAGDRLGRIGRDERRRLVALGREDHVVEPAELERRLAALLHR